MDQTNALAVQDYIIPDDKIAQFISPESYVVTDPSTGIAWVYYNGEPVAELGRKRVLPNKWVHPEPNYRFGRCKMIKADGTRCRQPVRSGWTVCKYHGAGSADAPAGRPPITGRYSHHLPTRYLNDYEEYVHDPNLLSMRHEMALLDVRMGELLQKLETADSPQAWNKIAVAAAMLDKTLNDNTPGPAQTTALQDILNILRNAIMAHRDDSECWEELSHLIVTRTKVADVERRRIEAAKKYLTLQEANAMLAYFVNSVMKNVNDPNERSRISEDLRVFAGGRTE